MTATRRAVRGERQQPVVLDEDQRVARRASRAARASSAASASSVASIGDVDVRPLEQAEAELHPQDPRDRGIEVGLVDPTVVEAGLERRAEGDGPRQLRVDAGDERQARRLAEVGRQAMGGREHLDADVVRGDDAVEAPLARGGSSVSSSAEAWQGTPSTSQ